MFLIYLSLPVLLATVPGTSGGPEFQCPGPGFYPDPYSCTAFYRCINRFMNYRYLCPAGKQANILTEIPKEGRGQWAVYYTSP